MECGVAPFPRPPPAGEGENWFCLVQSPWLITLDF